MKAKHRRTLELIFKRPVSGNVPWADIEALFVSLGGEVRVFHRPHPKADTDKGAVASIRKWLEANGVTP
ncbi:MULTISPECIES: type II toxin-antitoxin system HicA family toxin [Acetobacter]|uniref:type II toxin-antitoxin system HicA family toxin n=1 Tax=Acetobacter TaxID=434 RepID=UPI0039ED9B22